MLIWQILTVITLVIALWAAWGVYSLCKTTEIMMKSNTLLQEEILMLKSKIDNKEDFMCVK